MTNQITPEPDETYEQNGRICVTCGAALPLGGYAICGPCWRKQYGETYEQADPVMGLGRGVPIRGMNPKPLPSRLTWPDLVAVGLCLAVVAALGAWWLW
jgi:hypothetical protein